MGAGLGGGCPVDPDPTEGAPMLSSPPMNASRTSRVLAYRVWPAAVAVTWLVVMLTGGSTGARFDGVMYVLAATAVAAAATHAVFPLSTTARYVGLFATLIAAIHRTTDFVFDSHVSNARAAAGASIWALVVVAKVIIFRLTMPLVDADRYAQRGAGG